MDRTMKNSDIDEMVVCSKSLKSSNVGPITAPHNPYMFIIWNEYSILCDRENIAFNEK